MSVELRPALLVFAERMEMKLQSNDHKSGWQNCSEHYLFNRCLIELEESLEASRQGDRATVAAELVDAANFLMMLADNCWDTDREADGFPALGFAQTPFIEERKVMPLETSQ